MNSEQFLTLDLDTVRDIVVRDTLSINRETVVYKRLIDWGEEQYTRLVRARGTFPKKTRFQQVQESRKDPRCRREHRCT